MQSSSAARDSSSTQPRRPDRGNPERQARFAGRQRFGVTRKSTARQRRREQASGQLEFQPVGESECGRCGETRRFGSDETGRGQPRGNSGGCQPVPEGPQKWGNSPRGSSAIPKDRAKGQLDARPIGTAEGCEQRGNSKLHRRQSRRCARGETRRRITGAARRREEAGRPVESLKPAARTDPKSDPLWQQSESAPGKPGIQGNLV